MDIENLTLERDSAKEEVRLVERSVCSLKRLKIEDRLEKSQNKCKKLEETVIRLVQEKRESNNREKRAEEERDRIFVDNMKLMIEKDKLICELNKKANELKSKSLENEQLAGVHEDKRKSFDTLVENLGRQVQELKKEKSGALETVEKLKGEILKANRMTSELTDKVNEFKCKISESEQLARDRDEKCKSLDTLVVKMGQEIGVLKKERSGALEALEELIGEILEANRVTSELTEKVNELQCKNSENEQLARDRDEKRKSLDTLVGKMGQEIDELKKEKSCVSKTIGKLEAEIIEANRTIDDLRLKKSDSDKVIEIYRNRVEDLWPKIKKRKEDIANAVTVKAGDMADLVSGIIMAKWEGANLNFQDSRSKTGSSGSGNTLRGAGDGSTSSGLLKRGSRSLVNFLTRQNDVNMVKAPPGYGSESTNGCKKPLDLGGPHANHKRAGGGQFRKITHPPPLAAKNTIEILDSDSNTDDETKPNSSNGTNPGRGQSCGKRTLSDFMGEFSGNSTKKGNKNIDASCEREKDCDLKSTLEPKSDSRTTQEKFRLIDEDSSGSDGSCTDSKMEEFVGSFRR